MKKCFRVLRSLLLLVMVVCVCSGLAVVGKGYEAYQEAVDEISLEDKVAGGRILLQSMRSFPRSTSRRLWLWKISGFCGTWGLTLSPSAAQ